MGRLKLSLACQRYDRTRPILEGRVQIEGCKLTVVPIEPSEAFLRAYQAQEFDVTELSLSSHILTTAHRPAPSGRL